MKLAILGAGNVGSSLGAGLARHGHQISYAVRDPGDAKHAPLRAHAAVVPVREAVSGAEAVLLATPWAATEAAVKSAGDFGGKPLLDATNPIGAGLALAIGRDDSGAESVQRWATNARVVKIFNTTGAENMANPRFGDRSALMCFAGDDADACAVASGLAADLGFEPMRVGGLVQARLLEPMALVWIHLALVQKQGRDIAFGLLRRGPGG